MIGVIITSILFILGCICGTTATALATILITDVEINSRQYILVIILYLLMALFIVSAWILNCLGV